MQLGVVILIGLSGVILGASVFTCISKIVRIDGTYAGRILLTWFSMILGFGILPTWFMKRRYGFSTDDMGIRNVRTIEKIASILIVGAVFFYIIIIRRITDINLLWIVMLQNVGVSVWEEYFSKSVLYFSIDKITQNKYLKVLASACIFAFILHGNADFYANIVYRFPMALISGWIYAFSGNLSLPVTLHFVNNVLAAPLLAS